jgi:hypothetical protein
MPFFRMKGGFQYGSIPGREKQGLHGDVQPPPAQPGNQPKGKGTAVTNAVPAGKLGKDLMSQDEMDGGKCILSKNHTINWR